MVVASAGRSTGVVEKRAQGLIQHLPRKSEANMVAAIGLASARCASEGMTSFTESGIVAGWIGDSPRDFAETKSRETLSGHRHTPWPGKHPDRTAKTPCPARLCFSPGRGGSN